MTIDFKVGDTIWWLEQSERILKARIKTNVIASIEHIRCKGYWEYRMIDDSTCIKLEHSSWDMIARTKEELIELLYPTKIGSFDYNQIVYIVSDRVSYNNLSITKGRIRNQIIKHDQSTQYVIDIDKKDNLNKLVNHKDASPSITTTVENIYTSVDTAKHAINTWLNNNDN